jgi:hypothetical protein
LLKWLDEPGDVWLPPSSSTVTATHPNANGNDQSDCARSSGTPAPRAVPRCELRREAELEESAMRAAVAVEAADGFAAMCLQRMQRALSQPLATPVAAMTRQQQDAETYRSNRVVISDDLIKELHESNASLRGQLSQVVALMKQQQQAPPPRQQQPHRSKR